MSKMTNQAYGEMWQLWAAFMLIREGHQVNMMAFFNRGFDLLVSGSKVDVKAAPKSLSSPKAGGSERYRFTIDTLADDIDYLLICDDGTLQPNCYLVPGSKLRDLVTSEKYVFIGASNYQGKFTPYLFRYSLKKIKAEWCEKSGDLTATKGVPNGQNHRLF